LTVAYVLTVPVQVVAVDWSGARSGAPRKIWRADARDGRLTRLSGGRGREQLVDELIADARAAPSMVVGLDFAFSMPGWFLDRLGVRTAPELWSLVRQQGERWLRTCEPPFWGRPGRPRPKLSATPPWVREAERSCPSVGGIAPKSIFQIGGAGAVGTGSLRGMAALDDLRRAGFAIWPFDPPRLPLVVEIYPRLFTGPVAKSRIAARLACLQGGLGAAMGELAALAASSEDAFDAAVSALGMSAAVDELAALPATVDARRRLEGAIWRPLVSPRYGPDGST
jgi:hypothetical protein